jgi:hypothetical protein
VSLREEKTMPLFEKSGAKTYSRRSVAIPKTMRFLGHI